jgi:hypothetical protein
MATFEMNQMIIGFLMRFDQFLRCEARQKVGASQKGSGDYPALCQRILTDRHAKYAKWMAMDWGRKGCRPPGGLFDNFPRSSDSEKNLDRGGPRINN